MCLYKNFIRRFFKGKHRFFTQLLTNTALVVVVFIIVYLVIELIVRGMFRDQVVLFPRYHTSASYGDYKLRTLRPNSIFYHTSIDGTWRFKTNSAGFRNTTDFQYKKEKNIIRILSLGDSHTQGFEVRQEFTYSEIIKKKLQTDGIQAEVINSGVSGFSTAEQLILLKEELYKYQPDYVILGFFENDFEDNLKSGLFFLNEKGELTPSTKKEHIPGVAIQDVIYSIPGIQYLSENSYFYSILFNTIWNTAKSILAKSSRVITEQAVASKNTFTEYEKNLAALLIKQIYIESKKMGADFILLDLPTISVSGYKPSINSEFRQKITGHTDYFVSSAILSPYKNLGVVHVLHGHNHISEFTHTLFAIKVANFIQKKKLLANQITPKNSSSD